MRIAIDLSRRCCSEPGDPRPKVGAVIVKNGRAIAQSFRGGPPGNPGEHAEFIALNTLTGNAAAGATLYTTLEPCTVRGVGKTPCTMHIVNSGIRRVVIGILDPNPDIQGEGIRVLSMNKIAVTLLMSDVGAEIVELDSRFVESFGGHAMFPRPLTVPASRVISPYCELSIPGAAISTTPSQLVRLACPVLEGISQVSPGTERLERTEFRLQRHGTPFVDTVGDHYAFDDDVWLAAKDAGEDGALLRAGLVPVGGRPASVSDVLRRIPGVLQTAAALLMASGIRPGNQVTLRLDGAPLDVKLEYSEALGRWTLAPPGDDT